MQRDISLQQFDKNRKKENGQGGFRYNGFGSTGTGRKVDMTNVPQELVFGLDIGTRSIVGTVGYKNSTNGFVAVAQVAIEHETRAMIDGQIHDIGQVAATISKIKNNLKR